MALSEKPRKWHTITAPLLVALALLVLACGNGDSAETTLPDEAPGTTQSAVPTNTTGSDETTPEDSVGLSWIRVPHDPNVFGEAESQEMRAVAAGGPGFVAVGLDLQVTAAAVWTSENGTDWTWLPHNEDMFGGDGTQWMWDVVPGGPGLVAVGGSSHLTNRSAAVWTSADGVAWSRVAHSEAVFGGEDHHWMNSVVVGGPGLVAVGGTGFSDRDAAVWTSADGLTWSRVSDDGGFGGAGMQEMHSIAAGGPGLVAVGYESDESGRDRVAVVWTSSDGTTWTRVEDGVPGSDEEQEMFDVVVGGPGMTAIGREGEAAIWTSVDGITWSRVPYDEDVFDGTLFREPLRLTVGGPGLVAVGQFAYGNDVAAAVWTSADGINWSRVPRDDDVFGGDDSPAMNEVAASGNTIVAVGSVGVTTDEFDAAVWVGHSD